MTQYQASKLFKHYVCVTGRCLLLFSFSCFCFFLLFLIRHSLGVLRDIASACGLSAGCCSSPSAVQKAPRRDDEPSGVDAKHGAGAAAARSDSAPAPLSLRILRPACCSPSSDQPRPSRLPIQVAGGVRARGRKLSASVQSGSGQRDREGDEERDQAAQRSATSSDPFRPPPQPSLTAAAQSRNFGTLISACALIAHTALYDPVLPLISLLSATDPIRSPFRFAAPRSSSHPRAPIPLLPWLLVPGPASPRLALNVLGAGGECDGWISCADGVRTERTANALRRCWGCRCIARSVRRRSLVDECQSICLRRCRSSALPVVR